MVSETEDPQDLQGSSLQVECSVETVSEIFLYNRQFDKKQKFDKKQQEYLHWYELIIHRGTIEI